MAQNEGVFLPANQPEQVDTLNGVWRQGGNPAGISRAGFRNTGWISLGGEIRFGELKSVQEPGSVLYSSFSAKGDRNMNDWIVLGDISLSRNRLNDVHYNNAANIFSGNPYQWADTTGGDWTTTDILVGGAIGSPPIGEVIHVGIAVDYKVAQGARENRERPLYSYSRYRINPGIAWDISPNLQAGVHGFYSASNEDQEMGYFNQQDTFVYLLRGIGTFSQNTFNTAVRRIQGTQTGGGVQMAMQIGEHLLAMSAGYAREAETVTSGISNPIFSGDWTTHTIAFETNFRSSRMHSVAEFSVGGRYRFGEGIDPQLLGKNVELEQVALHAGYEWWNSDDKYRAVYRYLFSVHWDHNEKNDFVSLSAQTVQRLRVQTAFSWNPVPGNLQYGLSAGYSHPLGYALDFRNRNEVLDRIFIPDARVLNARIVQLSAGFTWFFVQTSYDIGFRLEGNYAAGFESNDVFTRSSFAVKVIIRT